MQKYSLIIGFGLVLLFSLFSVVFAQNYYEVPPPIQAPPPIFTPAPSSAPSSNYVQYSKKICSGNDLYWFDSKGVKQNLYQSCSDNNECTLDACQNDACQNQLKCDQTTCKKDSSAFSQYCLQSNQNTTALSNNPNLVVLLLVKKSAEPLKWVKTIEISPEEKIDFMALIKNNGSRAIDNINVKAEMPEEIDYKGELAVSGVYSRENIKDGLNLGSLAPAEEKIIIFSGKSKTDIKEGQKEIIAKANFQNFESSDSAKVIFKTSKNIFQTSLATIKFLIGKWYFWVLAIALLAFLFFNVFRNLFSVTG